METPVVRFQGIVYLPTEQEADKFGIILQDIASKVLTTFRACENRSLSLSEKKQVIKELQPLESQLSELFELDKKIATVYDTENPSKKKLEEKVAQIEKLIATLKPCFAHLDVESKTEQVVKYKLLFEGLLEVLRSHSELLKEQNEYKINALRNVSRKSLLSVKPLREHFQQQIQQNKPIQEDASVQRMIKETTSFLQNLVERAEERVPIIEALLEDYKDEVCSSPPPTVLKEATQDKPTSLQEKQLSPSSHSASANARNAPPDPSLLDLPCVLDDFELDKLKTLRISKSKGSSVNIAKTSPTTSPGVEAIIFRLVKDISDILYVVQIPIHLFDSCFSFEQEIPPTDESPDVNVSDEKRLSDLSLNLMKLDTALSTQQPKECVTIASAILTDVKKALASCAPQYKDAYEKVQASCPTMVMLTKEAIVQLEAKNMTGFTSKSEQLSSIIFELQTVISTARKSAESDIGFNLLGAADMVMKALAGLVSSK